MSTRYHIDFKRYYDHLCDVRMQFVADMDAPSLSMVTWIAGSYLIREFAKNITKVIYTIDGIDYRATKSDKHTFRLDHAKSGDTVCVQYEVYCYDLSVRTAFVDSQRIFGNFSSLLLLINHDRYAAAHVSLHIPIAFIHQHPDCMIACGLSHTLTKHSDGWVYDLAPLPAFDYLDYPFEIGTQDVFDFAVTDRDGQVIRHRSFIAGRHQSDLGRLQNDLQKICQAYVDWLGSTPFADYTFMTMVTGNDYGGLEHINSTALVSPRTDLPSIAEPAMPSSDYQRYLGLCSHEYFHAWWVKTVKPDVMIDNPLIDEAYTPLLWVFEGFTSYIDDLMLLRSGVIDQKNYLNLLTAQINRYLQTDGKAHQSVAESSFDTWIKLYRADENTANQGISYYNKGALVAWLLDVTLLELTDGKYRLFDVIKTFYDRSKAKPYALTTQSLGEVIGQMIGDDAWQSFYQQYVIGTTPLPIRETLAKFGVSSQTAHQTKPWGMTVDEKSSGLKIKHLHRDSQASLAGLSFGDVIIAINGLKASNAVLNRQIAHQQATGQAVQVHAFRRDELMVFDVPAVSDAIPATTHEQLSLAGDGGQWLNFG